MTNMSATKEEKVQLRYESLKTYNLRLDESGEIVGEDHPDAAGSELVALARKYERQHRVSFSEALRVVRQERRDLVEAWHATKLSANRGDNGLDVSQRIDRRARKHMARDGALKYADAVKKVLADDPAIAAEYASFFCKRG